ncbi:MAG: ATP-grasp domain-containing protein [Oscillospiraceae bacterium]|nr:ATP-grasp domain-containing protein [Oscillospiraceae bacterium]
MMNFLYISPNFPDNHWLFCRRLKDNGVTVLGVGDCPYSDLSWELRSSLTEYYWVPSLEDYDEVYRAAAFFIHKYGRIDYLESNNEYWLEQDAALREDFNIPTGFRPADMPAIKYKSRMKEGYARAGIPTALYHMVDDRAGCEAFIRQVGYPVIVKPDNGVGANNTYKLSNDADLEIFFAQKDGKRYIMEEFIDGSIVSYDAIVNSSGEPIYEAGNLTIGSIMDTVNLRRSCRLLIRDRLPEALRDMGRAALQAFGVKKRMVHFEFFHLSRDQRIGKAGEYVGLEVNMRPCGGILPTMMNYAHSTDVYQIWADMICFDRSYKSVGEPAFCVLAGRRSSRSYQMPMGEILREFGDHVLEFGAVDEAIATDMGEYIIIARFRTMEEVTAFFDRVLAEY